jgi:hypothetical protein
MKLKRTKLRLRKQVLISFPIAIFVSLLAVIYIVSQNTALAQEVKKENTLAGNVVETPGTEGAKTESILSNNQYINAYRDYLKTYEKDKLIISYAKLYNLNISKVVEIARELTDDYTSATYNQTYIIAPSNYTPSKAGNITSYEAGIVFFVKDIYTYPERYGSSIPEMRLGSTPQTERKYNDDGEIIMSNGMTFEQYVGKIADLFGVDKSTVLAISYHEAGVKTSNLFNTKNNIGGHKGLDGWKSFVTLEAGVIGHVLAVRNISTKHGVDISTPEGLSAFSSVYVNGYLGAPSTHWLEKVTYFKNKINSKDLFKVE